MAITADEQYTIKAGQAALRAIRSDGEQDAPVGDTADGSPVHKLQVRLEQGLNATDASRGLVSNRSALAIVGFVVGVWALGYLLYALI